jgi:quinol monooxygenase YgiN
MENERFGMQGRFTTRPGKGDELTAILLDAANAMHDDEDCLLYVVFRSPDDPDAVYVTEAWVNREAHRASLDTEETKAAIARARPLIASIEGTALHPLGGKGL